MAVTALLKRFLRYLRLHPRVRWLVWLAGLAFFYITTVIPVYYMYQSESAKKESFIKRPPYLSGGTPSEAPDATSPLASSYVDIYLTAVAADFNSKQLKVRASFMPTGDLAVGGRSITQHDVIVATNAARSGIQDESGITVPTLLARPVSVIIGTTLIKFTAGQMMDARDVLVPFLEGNQRDYPFDRYPTNVYVTAFTEPVTAANSTGPVEALKARTAVPFQLSFFGSVQSIHFRALPLYDAFTECTLYVRTRRTTTTIIFSLFVCLLMWLLTLSLSGLCTQMLMQGREVQPANMALGITLLFALPGLRNAQPGIPTVGVASDMLAYVWNILLITVYTVVIIAIYIIRWDQPAKEDDMAEQENVVTQTQYSAAETSNYDSTTSKQHTDY
ncbi:hypothetical protein THASP1DRAFT_27390 [Thamnocephalis sphaerospora]|uniref:DUF4436 domain-containing protein n=1 Tax=Thamnocephalis sphaerospora TaxID=78915 RepID=A0A4P9XYR7_9FUNG|nr:hypothetical protein THASP1DRAFT_27390 [Thamnocephalis sphaerospora]|eukprot:RKP10851.1 hypothetical protein THASP1DRAFT_27390 [Thamnocephalis sphaerospora]